MNKILVWEKNIFHPETEVEKVTEVVRYSDYQTLEAERDETKKSRDEATMTTARLVEQLQKLKEYVQHKPDCQEKDERFKNSASFWCTCGLNELLNEI